MLPPKGIVVGDPERAKQIGEIVDELRQEVADFLPVYTGKFDGERIFIGVHGIGMGSASFQINRIMGLGGRLIVRLGTAGALDENLQVGEVLVPDSISYSKLLPGLRVALSAAPDFELTRNLHERFVSAGMRVSTGPVVSTNSFYAGNEIAKEAKRLNIRAVEMECATLAYMSQTSGLRAACALIISNNVFVPTQLLTAKELKGYVLSAARAIFTALAETQP